MRQPLSVDPTLQNICQGMIVKKFYMKKRGMIKPWKNIKKIMQLMKRRGNIFLIERMRIEVAMPLHPVTLQIRMRL